MDESSLEVFVDGAVNYFSQVSAQPAKVDTPYLIDNDEDITFDYTGVIGVSGVETGKVCFTAPNALLRHLLVIMGEDVINEENMADLVGEVANTISGNARKKLGSQFMISTPSIVDASIDQLSLPSKNRSYVIPVTWNSYRAAVMVSSEEY